MRSCLIVKTGSTLPALAARRGDYEDWIAAGIGDPAGVEVCRACEGDALPDPSGPRAVLVTGSSALVTDREGWSERAGRWLAAVARRGTPVLAICYGHQLLADHLGGEVGPVPSGREVGAVEVRLTEEGRRDRLLGGLPATLRVYAWHRQAVLRLPPGARRLAENAACAQQAFRFGERAWGVQFHPEWDGEVLEALLEARAEELAREGLDPSALRGEGPPSVDGAAILARFGALV